MAKIINGTYSTGVYLIDPADNPVTILAGATVGNSAVPALLGAPSYNWTIGNSGVIQETGSNAPGIALAAGGFITNDRSGSISGYSAGISIVNAGTVINHGSIASSGTTGPGYNYNSITKAFIPLDGGVLLSGGGTVVNAVAATISTYFEGVAAGGGAVVSNAGVISASGTKYGFGVVLTAGGNVSNTATGTIEGGHYGILMLGTSSAIVSNQGLINSAGDVGVDLFTNGSVNNAVSATIAGARFGVYTSGTVSSTVINAGKITSAGTAGVALLTSTGLLSNASTGSIVGGRYGIEATGTGASTVINAGTISGTSVTGIFLRQGGVITNSGAGRISGAYSGIYAKGTVASTVVNTGVITGTTASGALLSDGGLVSNAATGTITGGAFGVRITNAQGSAVNFGSISSSQIFDGSPGFDAAGVALLGGGSVTNGISGTIKATWKGVEIGNTAASIGGTLFNQGYIFASNPSGSTGAAVWIHGPAVIDNEATGTIAGGPFGIVLYNQATVINHGSIGGTEYAIDQAVSGYAVRVIASPGAIFSGIVAGSKPGGAVKGVLELESAASSGTIAGFGSKYTGFGFVAIDQGAAWSFGGTVAASQTLSFGGNDVALTLSSPRLMAGTIDQFRYGDTIALTGITDVTAATLSSGNLLTLTESSGPGLTLQFDPADDLGGTSFNFSTSGDETILTAPIPCFAANTRILTPRGAIAVEKLSIGDRVLTISGGHQSIQWIGHRHIDCRRHIEPSRVLPIRIAAHAFGQNRPKRPLLLSPDHSVLVEGVLIPIKFLVNDTTVTQIEVATVSYYHIELPRHDVLLAEGLPAESYLETGGRHAFANADNVMELHPKFEPDQARVAMIWQNFAYAPLLGSNNELERARRKLEWQAALLKATSSRASRRRRSAG